MRLRSRPAMEPTILLPNCLKLVARERTATPCQSLHHSLRQKCQLPGIKLPVNGLVLVDEFERTMSCLGRVLGVCNQVSVRNMLFQCLGEVPENGRETYLDKREDSEGKLSSLLTSSLIRTVRRRGTCETCGPASSVETFRERARRAFWAATNQLGQGHQCASGYARYSL